MSTFECDVFDNLILGTSSLTLNKLLTSLGLTLIINKIMDLDQMNSKIASNSKFYYLIITFLVMVPH